MRLVRPLLMVAYVLLLAVYLSFVSNVVFTRAENNNYKALGLASPTYQNELLTTTANAVNHERESRGLPALIQSTTLDGIASERATDMAIHSYYAHKGSDGQFFDKKMKAQSLNYSFACENLNIASNPTGNRYAASWLASEAHKDCLLKGSHIYYGYATATIKKIDGALVNQQVIVAIYSNSP